MGGVGEQPLLMESKAGSKFLFYRASYRKTASRFSGRILAGSKRSCGLRPPNLPASSRKCRRHYPESLRTRALAAIPDRT